MYTHLRITHTTHRTQAGEKCVARSGMAGEGKMLEHGEAQTVTLANRWQAMG